METFKRRIMFAKYLQALNFQYARASYININSASPGLYSSKTLFDSVSLLKLVTQRPPKKEHHFINNYEKLYINVLRNYYILHDNVIYNYHKV